MDYGVLYAQRAWVTRERVVNTRGAEDFLTWVRRRRA
jgi:hypothetical protein